MRERPEAFNLYIAAIKDPLQRVKSWRAIQEEIYAPRRELAAEVLAEYPDMSASELGRRIGVSNMTAGKYKRRFQNDRSEQKAV